jgi:hypothetical protein
MASSTGHLLRLRARAASIYEDEDEDEEDRDRPLSAWEAKRLADLEKRFEDKQRRGPECLKESHRPGSQLAAAAGGHGWP